MSIKKKKFVPFSHDNLELKNELIDYARQLRNKVEFENQLASSFIYASFAEYLAKNLVDNLNYFIYWASYNYFGGIIFFNRQEVKKPQTFGLIINTLSDFEFPDKISIIKLFSEISIARNKIYHTFASSDIKELNEIVSKDVILIQEKSEELLVKINTIYTGLNKILVKPENKNNGTT